MLFDLYYIPFEAQALYPLFGEVLGVLFGALSPQKLCNSPLGATAPTRI